AFQCTYNQRFVDQSLASRDRLERTRKIGQGRRRQKIFHRDSVEGFADQRRRLVAFPRKNLMPAQVVAFENGLVQQPVVIEQVLVSQTARTDSNGELSEFVFPIATAGGSRPGEIPGQLSAIKLFDEGVNARPFTEHSVVKSSQHVLRRTFHMKLLT